MTLNAFCAASPANASRELETRTKELVRHLQAYGYLHFDDNDEYEAWASRKLGKHAAAIERLRAKSADHVSTPARQKAFYDYIASPSIRGVVASHQTDDIAQAAWAISDTLSGRNRVLDVGCNVGTIATWLAKVGGPGRRVVGMDVSPKSIASASHFATRLGLANAEFQGGDFDNGLPRGPFDAVVDMAAIQYAKDVVTVFRHVRAVLAPGGILVSVPMLGRAREIKGFLMEMREADLRVSSFRWVYARDLGRNIARPMIVAAVEGESIDIDVYAAYEEAKSRIAGPRVVPLFEEASAQ